MSSRSGEISLKEISMGITATPYKLINELSPAKEELS